jgi:conjugative transfer signal peptidase TraF
MATVLTVKACRIAKRGPTEGRRRARIALVCAAMMGFGLVSTAVNRAGRYVLWNDTPSEPEGLYIRARRPPAVGKLASFKAPPAAAGYVARRLSYLHDTPVLKTLAAGPGSFVCTTSGRLVINGSVEAPILAQDGSGARLPHWSGCRRLGRGEWFAYSARVPNSFDSRYYGPLRSDQLIAVYRPVWTASSTTR